MTLPLREASDGQARCRHWNGPLDVVAFRFACCAAWWPCHACHDETVGHAALPWPRQNFAQESVLCGVCRTAMTVPAYVAADSRCPLCSAPFNPRCQAHWPAYFDLQSSA